MNFSGAAAAPADARLGPRVPVAWRVRILTMPPHFIEGRTFNVSEQGAGLLLPNSFAQGSVLTAALAVPDMVDRSRIVAVTLQLKVVFNVAAGDLFRLGTQIVQITEAEQRLLRAWVQKG